MISIPIETLLTIIYVWVDEWYQEKGQYLLKGKVGRKPEFSDSEVITVSLITFPIRVKPNIWHISAPIMATCFQSWLTKANLIGVLARCAI